MHDAIQAAMGWTNSHLHRFRDRPDHRSPYFVTPFDVDEGEEGVLEDDVPLDQLISDEGDAIWYEYDFGTAGTTCFTSWQCSTSDLRRCAASAAGWRALRRTVAGSEATPNWRHGCAAGMTTRSSRKSSTTLRTPAIGCRWSGTRDHFAVDEANTNLSVALAEPVAVTGELADLLEQLERRGIRSLREVLGRPLSHGPTEVTDDEAARLTEAYRVLLDLVGEGVVLTSASYLPPKLVEQYAERTGITE